MEFERENNYLFICNLQFTFSHYKYKIYENIRNSYQHWKLKCKYPIFRTCRLQSSHFSFSFFFLFFFSFFFFFLSEKNHTQNENVRTPITLSIVSKHSLQHTIPFSPPLPTLTLMPLPMNGGLKMLQIP